MPEIAVLRGDVVYVNLEGAIGVEKKKSRPCLVVQNEGGCKGSPTLVIAPITDEDAYKGFKQQVRVSASELGQDGKDSMIDCGQIRTIDRSMRIDAERGVVSHLSADTMRRVDEALKFTLGLG